MDLKKGTIYFDGLCPLCSREIDHYRRQQGAEQFNFVDICSPSFDAEKHGVDPHRVHQVLHVRDTEGRLHTGVEAFRAIWRTLPRYQFLYRWTGHSLIRQILKGGYSAFARVRPYLPRKAAADCSDSPFCNRESHQP